MMKKGRAEFQRVFKMAEACTEPLVIFCFYESACSNSAALVTAGIDVLVCDEAHRLKNARTAIVQCISRIPTPRKLFITGTPVQNNLRDLHVLANLANPGILGPSTKFVSRFACSLQPAERRTPEIDEYCNRTRATIDMFMLRCGGGQHIEGLPPKRSYIVFVTPSFAQRGKY